MQSGSRDAFALAMPLIMHRSARSQVEIFQSFDSSHITTNMLPHEHMNHTGLAGDKKSTSEANAARHSLHCAVSAGSVSTSSLAKDLAKCR